MASGTITSLGIGSSLDIQGILDNLRKADETALTVKKDKITGLKASQDEFNVLNSLLLEMKSKASALSLSSNFLTRSVSVTSDILSVTSSDGAKTGSYSVAVKKLASQSTFLSAGVAAKTNTVHVPTIQTSRDGVSDSETVLAEGEEMTIAYGYGDDRKTITITGGSGGYTISDLETAINGAAENDDGGGGTYVTASVTTDDEGLFHIEIASTAGGSGEDNRVMITQTPEDMSFAGDEATFSYIIGDTEVSLSVAADTSLEKLAELINQDADNPGITASIINTGYGDKPFQLLLKADNTGEDNRISITTQLADLAMTEKNGSGYAMTSENSLSFESPIVIRQTDGDTDIVFQETAKDGTVTTLTAVIEDGVYANGEDLAEAVEKAIEKASEENGNKADYQIVWNENTGKLEISEKGELESVTFNWSDPGSTAAADLGFTADQTITPSESTLNAVIEMDGMVEYQRQSNTGVTDLVEGMSMTFTQTGSATITVDQDTTDIKENITTLISLYNDLITEIDTNDDYDEDEETWGSLAKYTSVDTMMSSLLSVFESKVGATTIFDLGFEVNHDGTVSIDEEVLDKALESNFEEVRDLFIGDSVNDGLGDLLNDHLRDLTKLGGFIESETGAIGVTISNLEQDIDDETERIEKKYETMTAQFVKMDSYMREMESMQSYVSQIFSATDSDDE